ncbi:MAG: 4'-phosphopantetheinyl transferase superfamily protein [Lachnospiraceae bacterium]|nr:4'-phosphopantetheinyl transferase superfamily protein [Lachnospiraceae bacterium]
MRFKIKEIEWDAPIVKDSPFMDLLGADRKEKVERLANLRLKNMHINSEIIIKEEAAKDLSLSPRDIEIKRTLLGKPFIAGYDNYYFSLSHCDNLILFASDNTPIGVDIEKSRSSYLKIAERFFTINEINKIKDSKNPKEEFLLVWTRKEAYVKLTGKGLSTRLDSFDVHDTSVTRYTTNDYISMTDGKNYVYSIAQSVL